MPRALNKQFFAVFALIVVGVHGDAKTSELLAQARAAIGGDARLGTIQALTCTGTLRRTIGDRQVSGEVTIDLQLPDKFLRTDAISPMGGLTLVTEQGVNGNTLLRRSRTLNAPPGAMIRTPPAPAAGSDAEAQALRNARAEFARMAMALLLTAPSSLPLDFTFAGEAESPDGRADVLEMKGAGAFAARIFLDKSTHRPLLLAYRGVSPRLVVTTVQRGEPPPSAGTPPVAGEGDVVDIEMFLDDYKTVDGVRLPHHISRAVGGETTEEWTFTTIRINPTFKPDTFAK
jgi:hypothetical protein